MSAPVEGRPPNPTTERSETRTSQGDVTGAGSEASPSRRTTARPDAAAALAAADRAIGDSLVIVDEYPGLVGGRATTGETPGAWFIRLRKSVEVIIETAPHGRASRSLLKLLTLVPYGLADAPDFPGPDADVYREGLRVGLERVRERMHAGPTADPAVALGQVLDAFEHCSTQRVADVLGTRPRQVRRWRRGEASRLQTARVLAVAEVVQALQFAGQLHGIAVCLWFFGSHDDLGGRRPVEMLNEDASAAREALSNAARLRGRRRVT